MKRVIVFVIVCVLFLSLPSLFKQVTCGFKVAKICIDAPFRKEWEVASDLSQETLWALLNQPFSYLDRGAQAYVFASQDGLYVLKLYRAPSNEEKLSKFFSASVIAYTKAKEETGLIFLHLNRTENALPMVALQGPTGTTFELPLDEVRFALQKRAVPFLQALQEAHRLKDTDLLHRRIDAWLSLLERRVAKGIYNTDSAFYRNCGFLGDQAIEIDFGNYGVGEFSQVVEKERHVTRFRDWMKKHDPEVFRYVYGECFYNEQGKQSSK